MQTAPRIRALIVDDYIETAQTVRKWLATTPDIQVVGVATTAQEAMRLVARYRPDIVVMDIQLADMDGRHAMKFMLREAPVHVILTDTDNNPEAALDALREGARDYLAKPLRADALVDSIRHVAQLPKPNWGGSGPINPMPEQQHNGPRGQHVIAVCGAKGGVGRSVIAANLAVALAGFAGETLLVDGNLQSGDAHVLLYMDQAPNPAEYLRDAQNLDYDAIQRIVARHESGVKLLRAPERLDEAAAITADMMHAILVEVREHFDMVVIDVDSAYSDATAAALEVADRLVVVTTPEITSINRVKTFLEATSRLEIPSEKICLVCNRYDGGYQIAPKQVERSLGHRFAALLPDDFRLVVSSINKGVPFVRSHRRASLSRAVIELAHQLHKDVTTAPATPKPARKGIFAGAWR